MDIFAIASNGTRWAGGDMKGLLHATAVLIVDDWHLRVIVLGGRFEGGALLNRQGDDGRAEGAPASGSEEAASEHGVGCSG